MPHELNHTALAGTAEAQTAMDPQEAAEPMTATRPALVRDGRDQRAIHAPGIGDQHRLVRVKPISQPLEFVTGLGCHYLSLDTAIFSLIIAAL